MLILLTRWTDIWTVSNIAPPNLKADAALMDRFTPLRTSLENHDNAKKNIKKNYNNYVDDHDKYDNKPMNYILYFKKHKGIKFDAMITTIWWERDESHMKCLYSGMFLNTDKNYWLGYFCATRDLLSKILVRPVLVDKVFFKLGFWLAGVCVACVLKRHVWKTVN